MKAQEFNIKCDPIAMIDILNSAIVYLENFGKHRSKTLKTLTEIDSIKNQIFEQVVDNVGQN